MDDAELMKMLPDGAEVVAPNGIVIYGWSWPRVLTAEELERVRQLLVATEIRLTPPG